MKLIFRSLLFILTLCFFTHCCTFSSDSCCGENFTTLDPPKGVSSFSTSFVDTNRFWPKIEMQVNYNFAEVQRDFQIISSAYACDPKPNYINLSNYIDSIKVKSSPKYTDSTLEDFIYYLPETSHDPFTLSNFNAGIDRAMSQESIRLEFNVELKPDSSDNYTFFFKYYKDGGIIDSSATQGLLIEKL